jgi:hypothetical protein
MILVALVVGLATETAFGAGDSGAPGQAGNGTLTHDGALGIGLALDAAATGLLAYAWASDGPSLATSAFNMVVTGPAIGLGIAEVSRHPDDLAMWAVTLWGTAIFAKGFSEIILDHARNYPNRMPKPKKLEIGPQIGGLGGSTGIVASGTF